MMKNTIVPSFNKKERSPVSSTAISSITSSDTCCSIPLDWLNQCFETAQAHRGKLFGRDEEVASIYEVYENVKTSGTNKTKPEVIFISGETGIGKTALAQSIQNQIIEGSADDQECCFVGRFYQLQRPEPHSALVEVFTHLISQVIDCNSVQELCNALSRHGVDYHHGGIDLIRLIPSLKSIILPNQIAQTIDDQANVSSRATALYENLNTVGLSTNRCKDLFRLLFRAVSSRQTAVVAVIEDLHWANESELEVLESLMQDTDNTGTVFICTHRTGNESMSQLLGGMLTCLNHRNARLTHFALEAVPRDAIRNLLVDLLSITRDRAEPFASILYDWTNGNMFHVWTCIQIINKKNLITLDTVTGKSVWDIEEIEIEYQMVKDVFQYKIGLLSETSQENIKVAACLGSKLDKDILLRLFSSNQEAVSTFIDDAAKADLILFDDSCGAWCFCQEKIYHSIPIYERNVYHYRIGRKLWREFDLAELSNFLFLVVGQFFNERRERVAVAKLCLEAGIRAVKLSNFRSSCSYLKSGILFLDEESWESEYDLTIKLHNAAIEIANSLGVFADVDTLVDKVIAHSKTYDDTYRARATQVHALGRSGKLQEAINSALNILQNIGEKIPSNQSAFRTAIEVSYIRWRVRRKTDKMILILPFMTDPKKLEAMEMMNFIFLYTSFGTSELMPLLGCRMVQLSLEHGLCAISCIGFAVFGAVVAWTGQSFAEADRLGTLGFSLLQKFDATPWLARISVIYYYRIFSWIRPFADCVVPLSDAYDIGVQYGDTEFAVCCITYSLLLQFEKLPLPDTDRQFKILLDRTRLYDLRSLEVILMPIWHLVKDLLGYYGNDINALRNISVDDKCVSDVHASDFLRIKRIHTCYMFKCYLFGLYKEAMKYAKDADTFASGYYGPTFGSFTALMGGLVDVAHARQTNCRHAFHAKKYSKLLLQWARAGESTNFIGKHYLLEAEVAALAGKNELSYRLYIRAIGACRDGNLLLSTALASERAARSLLEWGKNELAGPYFREAVAMYAEWGATMKVQHLQSEINELGF